MKPGWMMMMVLLTAPLARAQVECEQPNVIFALDRSGSMLQDGKWETAVDAITQLTRTFEHRLRFGMSVFPWGDDCAVERPDAVLAPIAPFNGPAIQQALSGFRVRPQRGNLTPIGSAVAGATSDLRALNDLDRRNFVVLLTDGMETCGGDGVREAGNAFMQDYPVFVIGFGGGVDRGALNAMAQAGGTERAWQAGNGRELFDAFSAIVDEATQEVCDGLDNDCDGRVDEGLPATPCETACGTGEQLCLDGGLTECRDGNIPAETCDAVDNDCDTRVDEVPVTPCTTVSGNPGTHPCVDGQLSDECVPDELFREEACDNLDNDGDGRIDENQDAPCMVECHVGRRICLRGSLTRCTAEPVGPERCNGVDDDCDGAIDEDAQCAGASICGPEGQCLQPCVQGECPDVFTCAPDMFCHPDLCEPFCAGDEICVRAECRRPCLLDQDCAPSGATAVCVNRLCAVPADGEGGAGGDGGAGGFMIPPPVIEPEPVTDAGAPDAGSAKGGDSGGCAQGGRGPAWPVVSAFVVLGWCRRRR